MKFANRLYPTLVLGLLTDALLLHAGCASTGYSAGGGGTKVPAAPTGLAALAGNAQVTLNWTGSSEATSYYVKRSTTTGGPYTQIATQAGTDDTDMGLTNGTKYFYVVSAYNSAGQSANSAEVNATPVLPPPASPTGLAATAGECPSELDLDGEFRRKQLSREALHDQRCGNANLVAHFQQLYGYRSDQRHKIFLRGFRGELRRRERQLLGSVRDAHGSLNAARDTNRFASNWWQRASEPELDREHRRGQVQRQALDNQRRTLQHSSRLSHNDELHRYDGDQWHDLLLRRLGGKHRGSKRQFRASKRHSCCAHRAPDHHHQSSPNQTDFALHLRSQFLFRRNRRSAAAHF